MRIREMLLVLCCLLFKCGENTFPVKKKKRTRNRKNGNMTHEPHSMCQWLALGDDGLAFWGTHEEFLGLRWERGIIKLHFFPTDYYLSGIETLGYLLWAAVAEEGRSKAADRICHYQKCQQSFQVIIHNISMAVGLLFVFQLTSCWYSLFTSVLYRDQNTGIVHQLPFALCKRHQDILLRRIERQLAR